MGVSKWIPDRKVWAGGVFIIAAYILAALANRHLGYGLQTDEILLLSVVLGKMAEYLLPPSLWDKIRRLDDEVIAIAARVPDVPVSPQVGEVAAVAAASPVESAGAATEPIAESRAFTEMMARIPARERPWT